MPALAWIPVPTARETLPACAPPVRPILAPAAATNPVFQPPAPARDSFPAQIVERCVPLLPALPAPRIPTRAPQRASALRSGPLPFANARCVRPARWLHQFVRSGGPLRIAVFESPMQRRWSGRKALLPSGEWLLPPWRAIAGAIVQIDHALVPRAQPLFPQKGAGARLPRQRSRSARLQMFVARQFQRSPGAPQPSCAIPRCASPSLPPIVRAELPSWSEPAIRYAPRPHPSSAWNNVRPRCALLCSRNPGVAIPLRKLTASLLA